MANDKNKNALRLEKREDGVAIVYMDVPGEAVNTLKSTFAQEFTETFGAIKNDASIKAVVFASAKKDSFLAGADISMIEKCQTAAEAEALSLRGQDAMNLVEALGKPVVAAIHGACLGGGLETALACHARVATNHKKTKLGLPEVQLGLLPGAGGTQRLPRLIGVQAALDLMLTGKQVDAKKAKKLGIVDEVVPEPVLLEAAIKTALSLAERPKESGGLHFKGRSVKELLSKEELTELALAENPLGRKVLFDQAKKALFKKARGNYPAPERILEAVKAGLEGGFDAGLLAERKGFGELTVSPEAASLMSIFFATQSLKKDDGVDGRAEAKAVKQVAMLGAGLMGAGISYVTAAFAKTPVRLKDRDDEGVLRGLSHVRSIIDKRVKRKRMSRADADRLMSQVSGTTDYRGFGDVNVVIEAVFEDIELKHNVLKQTEEATSKDCIFASNTSSIPITEIAKGASRPENVIGMHYFSPVDKMPLLEIIVTDKTADWVTATCVELGKKQGKTVIVVNDGTGFYTTRILAPFMNEAAFILGEGVAIEDIDNALMDFGFPVGPIKLTDEVGIDVGAKVGKVMRHAFGDRLQQPGDTQKLLDDNRYGRKNGRGFYLYENGKSKGVDSSVYETLGVTVGTKMDAEDIAQRCVLQMVNEAALCFGEGILRSARDGDIGAIFGLGFAPFRGGPFRYVDAVGAATIVARLERYRDLHGARFEPAPILVQMAKDGTTFHGEHKVTPGQTRATSETSSARA